MPQNQSQTKPCELPRNLGQYQQQVCFRKSQQILQRSGAGNLSELSHETSIAVADAEERRPPPTAHTNCGSSCHASRQPAARRTEGHPSSRECLRDTPASSLTAVFVAKITLEKRGGGEQCVSQQAQNGCAAKPLCYQSSPPDAQVCTGCFRRRGSYV